MLPRVAAQGHLATLHRPVVGARGVIEGMLAGERPDQALLDAEARRELADAFARLAMRDRAILTLTEINGLGADEAGRILDMRPGAVRVAAHRARGRLLALLQPAEARA